MRQAWRAPEAGRRTLGSYAAAYLTRNDLRESPRALYASLWRHHLEAAWSTVAVADVTPQAVRLWHERASTTRSPRPSRSPTGCYTTCSRSPSRSTSLRPTPAAFAQPAPPSRPAVEVPDRRGGAGTRPCGPGALRRPGAGIGVRGSSVRWSDGATQPRCLARPVHRDGRSFGALYRLPVARRPAQVSGWGPDRDLASIRGHRSRGPRTQPSSPARKSLVFGTASGKYLSGANTGRPSGGP